MEICSTLWKFHITFLEKIKSIGLAGGAGRRGRKRQKMQKVNTNVLELESVLCGLVAAADLQLSGWPDGRVQQETNQLVRLQACIYWNIP